MTFGAALILSTIALVSANSASASGPSGVLTVGIEGAGTSLNPAVDVAAGDQLVMQALPYESLIHYATNGTPSPGLATSWGYVGTGNTTFQLTLRPNMEFSDGSPVNSAAVATWLEYYMKTSSNAGSIGTITSIDTPSPTSVVIHLGTANPEMPYYLSDQFTAGAVVSPQAIANPSSLGNSTDGAGPYMLEASETVANSTYTFVPNPNYYDPSQIRFSQVVVKIITSPSSMLEAAVTGQVDVAYGDSTTVNAAVKDGLQVASGPIGTSVVQFADFVGKLTPAFGKIKVRQAMNYALNRKAIAEGLVGKYGAPTSEMVTPDGYDPAYKNYYNYDPSKARALLKAAGYQHGFTTKVVVPAELGTGGVPFTLAVAKYLGAVGIKVKITSEATQAEFVKVGLNGTFPLLVAPWTEGILSLYNTCWAPKAIINFFHAHLPEINTLDAQATVAANPAKYLKLMTDIATKDAFELPVYEEDGLWYASKNIGGLAVSVAAPEPVATDFYLK